MKRRIARIEGRSEAFEAEQPAKARLWRFGIPSIDAHLPRAGLAIGGLHEIAPAAHGDMGAAIRFTLALLEILPTDDRLPHPTRQAASTSPQGGSKPILWCQSAESRREFGRPYGPGIVRCGLAGQTPIFLTARREDDVLWAIEEAVRSRAMTAVIGEVKEASFLASRRLALIAAEAGLPILLIAAKPAGTSAAHTRFSIAARPGRTDPWDAGAPGDATWHIALRRVRGGRPGTFDLEWSDEAHHFRLAAALADRPDAPRRPQSAAL